MIWWFICILFLIYMSSIFNFLQNKYSTNPEYLKIEQEKNRMGGPAKIDGKYHPELIIFNIVNSK